MASSRIIEYLLSIRRPGNSGGLVSQGQTQVLINIFPPGRTVTIQIYPYQGDYMDILFEWAFDTSLVPNAFYAWGSYFGARPWEGIAHSWWMENNVPGFVFITAAEPAYAMIYNRSPLTQFYGATSSHIAIKNEEDYLAVYAAIEEMASSSKQNELVDESNQLLRQLIAKTGA